MHAKIHKQGDQILVAACDAELIGKVLEEGEIFMEIKEKFYGEKTTEDELRTMLKNASTGNLVGKKVIKIATELNIISEDDLIRINGIPHGQFLIL